MIKKFGHFISESRESDYLLYYAFDWDDNILNMPTVIHMEKRDGDSWNPIDISTAEFAEVRGDSENWRVINNDPSEAFSNFRDNGPMGESIFTEDTKKAISSGSFGPAWDDFIECLSNGSLFAIITARGHESGPMRKGVEWIIDNVLTEEQLYQMYNQVMKYAYFFGVDKEESSKILKGQPSQNELIKVYLDNCDFVGVSSPSKGGSPSNPEKAKEDVFLEFTEKVNEFINQLNSNSGDHWVAKLGFSDDDNKNKEHMEHVIELNHERFPNIVSFVVKGTKDPLNITKKVVSKEFTGLTETSQQTPGMEGSILKFTQFGNMAGQLNPIGQDQRQDDSANQIKRQTKYLTKTSSDILGTKKRKKKVIKSSK